MKTRTSPLVTIDALAMARIWEWTRLAPGEFSCLASVTDDLVVEDVQLLQQVCSGASTELDQGAIAQLLLGHDEPQRVRAWIHSHGELDTFWSGQDEDTIEALENESFLVSIVVNKAGDLRCRLDVYDPIRITIDQAAVQVRSCDEELLQECAESFAEQVTQHIPSVKKMPWAWGPPWSLRGAHVVGQGMARRKE